MADLGEYAQQLRTKLERSGSLVIDVKAIPRSRAQEVSDLLTNGVLKLKVVAAPERGRANDEVCAVVAEYLGVPPGCVEVILGHTSQQKRVRITLRR
jgi:uncharacterized protein YggU (UPF0235/DUF167 family)